MSVRALAVLVVLWEALTFIYGRTCNDNKLHVMQDRFEWAVSTFEKHADDFIAAMKSMAGAACMTSKMHGLLHVSEDLRRLKQQLYGVSTYPFETALMRFKSWLRSGNQPLKQIR